MIHSYPFHLRPRLKDSPESGGGGLTLEQAAGCLGVSLSTAERGWRYARAWLYDAMGDDESPEIRSEHRSHVVTNTMESWPRPQRLRIRQSEAGPLPRRRAIGKCSRSPTPLILARGEIAMGSPTPRKDFSVRITVVGHASSRYLGAADRADADARNKLLSEQRAETVRGIVEYYVQRRLDGVKIESRTAGVPRGFQLGAEGVGNTQPRVKEPDDGDSPANRVAVVTLELLTADSITVRKPRLIRADARTHLWMVQVLQLRGGSVGVGIGQIRIALRNVVSGREMKAYADLIGGGTPSVGDTALKVIKSEPVSDPIPFYTNRTMGFADFNGVFIRLSELNASVAVPVFIWFGPGYGATYRRLSFVGLGSGAEGLVFDTSHGMRWSNDLAGSVTSGKLKPEGSIPSDWIDLGTTYDSVPVPVGKYQEEGLTVGFPTGKSGATDLTREDKEKLEDFVSIWAAEVNKLISKGFALTTR